MAAALSFRRFPLAHASAPRRTTLAPPRYHVKLYLSGGIDSVYTLDPKEKRDVAAGVDVPYGPNEIVSSGPIQFGPHFAPLLKWAPRFTIVKGVDVSTANHNTGQGQALRLRTKITNQMPSIFEILGAHRDGQPLGSVSLGAIRTECHTPSWFGEPGTLFGDAEKRLFARVDAADPEELRTLGKVLAQQARQLKGSSPAGEAQTAAQNLGDTAAFFERVADLPKFKLATWESDGAPDSLEMSYRMQRALWLLENDLTATVFISADGGANDWDTHTDNARRQAKLTGKLVGLFNQFLGELERRSNRHGRLIDQTALLCASELGRMPYLNDAQGKDHFPEAPFMFAGPWFPAGKSFGKTLKQFEAAPIDLATGGAGKHHLRLDDVGTTLLALSGIDPERYGYNGTVMDFLVNNG